MSGEITVSLAGGASPSVATLFPLSKDLKANFPLAKVLDTFQTQPAKLWAPLEQTLFVTS